MFGCWLGRGRVIVTCAAMLAGPVAAQSSADPSSLPQPDPTYQGTIGRTLSESGPQQWPRAPKAPKGAPNIVVVLTDDVGFAASSAFGGPIPTPNLDKLAAAGLRYTQFHTTALCSPTRAALLTGRNHHEVGFGSLEDTALGYPGYWAVIPRSAATIAEILKDSGYNTAFFGKHHNTPASQATAAGPFDLWPTGLGFEYFYGFLGGDADQWQPRLFRNTSRIPDLPPGEILDRAMADDAIHYLHEQNAAAPDKPFFLYYATGSGHAPHHAPVDWINRFRGKFDQGWDRLREESFARQKAAGIIPQDAILTPRPAELPAWDSLSPERKAIDSRFMEVYAAAIAYQDAQIGRILDEIRRMGLADNTLVMFVEGDNGASGEGTPEGTLNEIGHLGNGYRDTEETLKQQALFMGGPKTYELYPAGWAWALNTPFQWMKQVASHLGGIRNGLVVSWPAGIAAKGQVRSQFGHVVDIVPTILEVTGIKPPETVNGVRQQPIEGTSLAYSFADPNAAERHTTQYFEMLGNRGIYHDGWLANTKVKRAPWLQTRPQGAVDSSYDWELYDLRHDFSQAHDLASAEPDRLKALQDLWWQEAKRNQVLPLDDDFSAVRAFTHTIAYATGRTDFTYWGKGISVAQAAAPGFAFRSFRIEAEIKTRTGHDTGVIAAVGSLFGGWSFYLKDGVPIAVEAVSQRPEDQHRVVAGKPLPSGMATLSFAFDRDPAPAAGGMLHIAVNGNEIGSGRIEKTINVPAGLGETFDIGSDTGATVSDDYPAAGAFPGEIEKLSVHLGPLQLPKMQNAVEKKVDSGAQ